jgi:hypothetical protein
MEAAPSQQGPKKPETGQCNLDKAAINLNGLRDVCRNELVRLLAVRDQNDLSFALEKITNDALNTFY